MWKIGYATEERNAPPQTLFATRWRFMHFLRNPRMSNSRCYPFFTSILALLIFTPDLFSEDWPNWRHDSSRTASTIKYCPTRSSFTGQGNYSHLRQPGQKIRD